MMEDFIMVENMDVCLFIFLFIAWGDKGQKSSLQEQFLNKILKTLFKMGTKFKEKQRLLQFVFSYLQLGKIDFDLY